MNVDLLDFMKYILGLFIPLNSFKNEIQVAICWIALLVAYYSTI